MDENIKNFLKELGISITIQNQKSRIVRVYENGNWLYTAVIPKTRNLDENILKTLSIYRKPLYDKIVEKLNNLKNF